MANEMKNDDGETEINVEKYITSVPGRSSIEGSTTSLKDESATSISSSDLSNEANLSTQEGSKKIRARCCYCCGLIAVLLMALVIGIKVANLLQGPDCFDCMPWEGYPPADLFARQAPNYLSASLESFNEDTILTGYETKQDLRRDLEEAAKYIVNQVLFVESGDALEHNEDQTHSQQSQEGAQNAEATATTRSAEMPAGYSTNNQESNVEEGDIMVSDGTHVYAVIGDRVVVLEAVSGVQQYVLQLEKCVYIGHIHLYQDRLMLITEHFDEEGGSVLSSRTQVMIYRISTDEEGVVESMELVHSSILNGQFQGLRTVGPTVRIVTNSFIDYYTHLISPLSTQSSFSVVEDYMSEAMELASITLIPRFVDGLLEGLFNTKFVALDYTNMLRIQLLTKSLISSSKATKEEGVGGSGEILVNFLTSLNQVYSMDITADTNFAWDVFSSFSSSEIGFGKIYANEEVLVLGEQLRLFEETATNIKERNFSLLTVVTMLPEGKVQPQAIGMVNGLIMNSLSLDAVGNSILRVATVQDDWESTFVVDGEPSTTLNSISLLSIASGSVMTELGQLPLGKPNERFTVVRFFDNVAYAMTFNQIDPFYVLDLEDPSEPKILSELILSGFSQYIHPLNDDHSRIIAIGREVDEETGVQGHIMVTLFDMSEPTQPVVVQRLHLSQHDIETSYTYSNALEDFKSIRYLNGRLILPVVSESYQGEDPFGGDIFTGFVSFLVDESSIVEECKVKHSNPFYDNAGDGVGDGGVGVSVGDDGVGGYDDSICEPYYPTRSMIFEDGSVLTAEQSSVKYTDLQSCEQRWQIDLSDL